jgi:hypothetical protein
MNPNEAVANCPRDIQEYFVIYYQSFVPPRYVPFFLDFFFFEIFSSLTLASFCHDHFYCQKKLAVGGSHSHSLSHGQDGTVDG